MMKVVEWRGDERLDTASSQKQLGGVLRRAVEGFRGALVPAGYPHSVREEYVEYQVWDSIQAVCSYVRGIICTSAVLEAAGVGEASASALAAAVLWVLKDGFALVGSLIFSCFVGSKFDSRVKQWRLFADAMNDVGLALDLVAPLFKETPKYLLFVGAVAATCKTMCGTTAGATKSVISAHLALSANFGDVASKENAQETAVTLLGLALGTVLIRKSNVTFYFSLLIFTVLTVIHLYANCRGVKCLRLATINPTRAHLLIDAYYREHDMSRGAVARLEPLFRRHQHELKVQLGVSISRLRLPLNSGLYQIQENNGIFRVALSRDSEPTDQLRALAHARLVIDGRTLAAARSELDRTFDGFIAALTKEGWDVHRPLLDPEPYTYQLISSE